MTIAEFNAQKAERERAYRQAFERERAVDYPMVDAFEQQCGFALDRERLEASARILACPLKVNPPNWQHGRILYAAARQYVSQAEPVVRVLDIGTAKGFSALCLHWAVHDEIGQTDAVTSVDVLDPCSHAQRNTVAECEGPKILAEILEPWPEARHITFLHSTGIDVLKSSAERIHVAFVDGKHQHDVVRQEGELLAARQQPGDLAIFDDLQVPGVSQAVKGLARHYHFVTLAILPNRAYAVGTRK